MLTVMFGTDWIRNRDAILKMIASDVAAEKMNRILIVPELISHEMERRLCQTAGDTASRFAEVLSFTRLYRRVSDAAGHGAQECMDNGGRVVAMASAARQLHSKLKTYASVETRPEFLSGLVDAVDEFKRCCISSENLMMGSRNTEGTLAQKLEELSLILETYDAICVRGKRDPSDQMTWLLEQLEVGTFAQNHVFYIDGFPDFTRQHMAIIEHMICSSEQVVISVTCDKPHSSNPAFEKAGETAGKLIRFAKEMGVSVNFIPVTERNDALQTVRRNLFHGEVKRNNGTKGILNLKQFRTPHEECYAAAEWIMDLIESGARFRDISIVCTDMATYQNAATMVFDRCKIPLYLSGTEDILEKPVIATVLAALDAALSGFEQRDLFRYMKSALSPISLSVSDQIENYAIMWNITGRRWQAEWTYHPEGLDAIWNESTEQQLQTLNTGRKQIIEPLIHLSSSFAESKNVADQVIAIYQYFEEIELANNLSMLANLFDQSGDYRNGQILNQLWEILLSALEQLYDVLGETAWDSESFTRLFKLLLSQYDVGTIPPVLDAVMMGPVSAMRCQQAKHLIILGAQEGALPGYSGAKGILSDQERVAIRKLGIPLTGGSIDGIQAEFAEIYGVFCGAEESISVFCSSGQPSFIYRRLLELTGEECNIQTILGPSRANKLEAGALLLRASADTAAEGLGILDEYVSVRTCREYAMGTVERNNIEKLYGNSLYLSASQIDKQADCKLAYFLHYGLKAKERKPISIDPAEFGTYVHAVLEKTAKDVMELGGFHEVSLKKTLEIADKYSEEYVRERFSQIDSNRVAYLYHRNTTELKLVVEELWQELHQSQFAPADFEVAFGDQADLRAIPISGKSMNARLRGFIDRVDVWRDDRLHYFRVVDYKTGKKDFDYCDVFNGYGLQMLLYLFALEDAGTELFGENLVPAGVQYFPARVPMIPANNRLTDDETSAAREKSMKRKGLLLAEERVLEAMEPVDKPVKLNYIRKKDGTISGDLADRAQLRLLKAYIGILLGNLVDDIASGDVTPNPYTRGSSHNACTFCPYGAICRPAFVEGRRDYRAMSAQRFWEEIGKEMEKYV